MVHVFGLTGGIGSGKSTVASRWRELGLPVIDADQLAREVVSPGSDGLVAVCAEFGADVLAADGTLDRKELARRVFGDTEKRRRLEAITHPRVRALGLQKFADLAALGEPLAAYEVPLLVESGMADVLRPLVVVAVPEHVQLERARARDGASDQEIRARMAAQLPLADKVAVADYVIDNSSSRAETAARTDQVLRAICAALGVDPARYGLA